VATDGGTGQRGEVKMSRKKKRRPAQEKADAGTPGASEASGERAPKLPRKLYEREIYRLQVELCKLQDWVKQSGSRVIVVFEGRDAAGKGGVIKRIMERVSPRVFRVVALPAPSDRERSQLYLQRYITQFPAAGEVVLFDRSWYNRAGVERVMGFCSDDEYRRFMANVPEFEHFIVEAGIILIKYWLTVTQEEQERRFRARIEDPTKQWKLSPMDLESMRRWYDYSRARDAMLEVSDTAHAPWHIVDSNDKRRARLNCISHLLAQIPYEGVEKERVTLPKRSGKGSYDDVAALASRSFVPSLF
jgi:polyphosphate kinase 2